MTELQLALSYVHRKKLVAARDLLRKANRVILVGNGGSSAIASHIAVDYTKNGGKTAITFSDPSATTCIANDYGYDQVYAQQIKFHAQESDLLVAISSSGKSPNILNAVNVARAHSLPVITLSGFDVMNPLKEMGDVNFWIDSHDYGIVELTSEAILHSMIGKL